ncbi:MAG: hypothetical protein M1549_04285 [Candidatus Dependentiae bacterium]|nr:hypothetical protein [Candidatus Dependentiae bacterium]
MPLPHYVVKVQGGFEIYPSKKRLVIGLLCALLLIFVTYHKPESSQTHGLLKSSAPVQEFVRYAFLIAASLGAIAMTLELLGKKAMVSANASHITLRAIPFWPEQSMAWADIKSIEATMGLRQETGEEPFFVVIHAKSPQSAACPNRGSWHILSRRRYIYISSLFLPCSTKELRHLLVQQLNRAKQKRSPSD